VNVYLPKDRVTNQHQGYGFVEFRTEDDADYVRTCPCTSCHAPMRNRGCLPMNTRPHAASMSCAGVHSISLVPNMRGLPRACLQAVKVLNMIKVYGKPIRVNKASQDKRSQDMGANLFIGNLDPEVDEKVP
jgi:splicing factor 3B subunit 4